MARINLLPWREQLREERKKRFITVLMMSIVLGAAVVFLGDLAVSSSVNAQASRNLYLQSHIKKLNKSIAEIKDLRKKREQLLERMTVIQGLQGNRPVSVRVFDQLVRVVPKGVYFKKVSMEDSTLKLVGIAESNNQISALMRNFNSSEWFTDPNLTAVRKVTANGERQNEFDLTIQQTTPDTEDEEDRS
ncbi:pilus assembly protein PilN [Endozoicomonas montiporae]|uniref:Pilus assembly protein PilN n=2 Tax=Endozoicomonas montiporae TaxID=1027273 RepID=A0A081N4A9_9GAMM|nr:PilN domain-containing protein [Endozoicomonas montiporae]AMO57877.1 type 4 pili biogenesis protein PilN [Endozoicomonas montiporae CL-33]KEQ13282.1 pilus assembly protein PilN [Endozoicomonas montiporae]